MSESTTDAAAAAAAAAVQADADAAALAAHATIDATTDATPSAEEAAAAAEAAKKPTRQERHVANLTRKAAEETRAREAAERRAEAAEALLAAGKEADPDKPLATPPASREPDREALRAEIRFNDRLAEIDVNGKKELGADAWETAKATLTGLGAVRNMDFLQALAETDHPAQIFASLADDTDALLELLSKPRAAMGTRLGRLDASFAKPAARPLSAAPKPAARVEGGAVIPAASLHDPKLTDAEFTREAQKLMPHLFGGKRRVA